jgi:hypothetical protein
METDGVPLHHPIRPSSTTPHKIFRRQETLGPSMSASSRRNLQHQYLVQHLHTHFYISTRAVSDSPTSELEEKLSNIPPNGAGTGMSRLEEAANSPTIGGVYLSVTLSLLV